MHISTHPTTSTPMSRIPTSHRRRADGPSRTRWAAIGAAIAVTLGAGGMVRLAGAASSDPSSFVAVDPVRVLDTRDPTDVGLAGPFASQVSQDLRITGTIDTTAGARIVVPDGATAVTMNVTMVSPSADGFLSVRPADSPGAPTTSSLNVAAGTIVPNAVTVQLPTSGADAGTIEITFDAYGRSGPSTDVLIDVTGYFVAATTGSVPAPQPAPAAKKTVAGIVTDAGTVLTGTGFTAQRTATGRYTITFPAGTWSTFPVITLTPFGVAGFVADLTVDVATSINGNAVFEIVATNQSQLLADSSFMFTVVAA